MSPRNSSENPSDFHPEDSDTGADEIEALMSKCLSLPESERSHFLENACRDYPEWADELRGRLQALAALGIDVFRDTPDSIPERLGEFRLIRRLGSGGMGVIYLAEQEPLQRKVALKLIRPENLYFPSARDRFRREVEAAARLQHPSIVPIYTVGEDSGLPYFAMEWIDGPSLADVIKTLSKKGELEVASLRGQDLLQAVRSHSDRESSTIPEWSLGTWVRACLQVTRQICGALTHAHERGVLHRDVKPSNVLAAPEGRVVLVDFGLAQTFGSVAITKTGSQIGSLAYMSPEQHRGTKDLDERTDIYSLGVTLYELLSLRIPFIGEDAETLRRNVLAGRPRLLRSLNSAITSDVETVCLKAMAKEPEYRYESAEAFRRDLDNLLELRPIDARPPNIVHRMKRWIQRRPVMSGAIALNTILLLALPIYFLIQIDEKKVEAIEARDLVLLKNKELDTKNQALESSFKEIVRLADAQRVSELLVEQERLYPSLPKHIQTLEEWLLDARAHINRRSQHEEDRNNVLAEVNVELGNENAVQQRWRLSLLNDLLNALDTLHLAEIDVKERLLFASTVKGRSIDDEEAIEAWDLFFESLDDSEIYDSMDMEPQLGLFPIGQNQQTGLWEFVHLESGDIPTFNEDGSWSFEETTGVIFVLLPGGDSTMGSWSPSETRRVGTPYVDPQRTPSDMKGEEPVHEVQLDSFFISKYEMTRAQWFRVTRTTSAIDPLVPIADISWRDATLVLDRLGLFLPTEAQWEYACRAGTVTSYSFGDDPKLLIDNGNVASEELVPTGTARFERWKDGYLQASPVGSFAPNPFGLYDMHGNLSEWCRDWFLIYQRESVVRPGDGLREGETFLPMRCRRGGSFVHLAENARSARREGEGEEEKMPAIGVRPVKVIER